MDSFKLTKAISSAQGAAFEADKSKAKLKQDRLPSHDDLRPPSLTRSKIGGQIDSTSSRPTTAPATSFSSNGSTETSHIFTPPDGQDGYSSNETSFHSADPHSDRQDLYPCTQGTAQALDRSFHEATELMEAEHPLGVGFEAPYLEELNISGPFEKSKAQFPPGMSFRKRYELLRISQNAGLSISDLIASTRSCGDDYQKLWSFASVLADRSASKLPDRGKAQAWEFAHGTYQDDKKAQSVIFSGKLEWNERHVPGLFHLQLHPLKLEEGCLFHRAYGSDRFMSVFIPPLARSYLPDHLKQDCEAVHASVTEWLATGEHNIAGRTWKAFFVEGAKRRWRKRTRDMEESDTGKKALNVQGFKIHLFAIDGMEFLNTNGPSPPEYLSGSHIKDSIENLLMWHIPIGANIDKTTDCKVFQRFSLGLSQTLPTVTLEPSEFVYIEDRRNSLGGPIMNDGCARMSASLGRAIADKLGLEEVPSIFQARIAGAKGVWMVDHDEMLIQRYPTQMKERKFCIEVSESQLKIKPHPRERLEAHATQRTFAVVGWSKMPRPASLNFQILAILCHGGVKKEALTKLLLADQCQYHEALFQAMNSRLRLREWIEQNRTSIRGQEDIPFVGAWPDEGDEQIIMLLEHGFMPQDCPLLLERIRSCLAKNLTKYVDKLQIRVPQSTYLYCIADPYSVLNPDEVHLGFSGPWKDSATGLSTTILDGIDVLVGRLPALLPSDIQRRRAVWRKELHHFRNVIVFPSTGNVCLAEMLSGGDYDGDMPWVCWDESIVQPFQNSDVTTVLTKAECNLVNKSRDMRTIFSDVSRPPVRTETEDFFRGCFRFNLHPSLLPTCTLEHEKVSYHEGSLSHHGAEKLAILAGHLVDSSKQGDFLSNKDWQRFRNAISPRVREKPAYKENEKSPVPKEGNVIDFLKFEVAVKERDKTLTEFHQKWPRKDPRVADPVLTTLWRTTKEKASANLATVLQQLQKDVDAVGEEWLQGTPKNAKFTDDGFNVLVARLHQKFSGIEPLQSEHEMSARWISETGETFCHWHLLRASCLYNKFAVRTMCWFLAGHDLCHIKIGATGPSRTMLLEIYKTYRPDRKTVKRLVDREEDEGDVEEIVDD